MIYKKEYKEKNKEKIHCSKVPAEKSIDFRPQEANEWMKKIKITYWLLGGILIKIPCESQ